MEQQEAWLEGKIENVSPLLMPAVHALIQSARDLKKAVENLTVTELQAKPNGAPSVGFHLKHIAGSVDRLLTYARGENLSDEQFAELVAEPKIDRAETVENLLQKAIDKIEFAVREIKSTPEENLFKERFVGRMKLPTNVFGLLFHIAEHTQRHTGQIVTTAKIVRVIK